MVLSMQRWTGKVAIVTGASSGIGAAIVAKLVDEGMLVVGLARRLERMEELAKKLTTKKGKFYPHQCDVSQESDIIKAFEYAKKLGPIHVLVNNAGTASKGNLSEQPTKIWKQIMDVNVMGMCIATREAIQDMKKNNVAGHIFQINSIAGHSIVNLPGLSIYSASKYAVTALTETLRKEMSAAKQKIRVTSISPGVVKTEIFEVSGLELPTDVEVPSLQPEDIADGVVYILSTPQHVNISELTIQPVGEEL